MAWTYDATQLDVDTAEGRKNVVRLRIGDVDELDPLLQDEEIYHYLLMNGDSIRDSAIEALQALLARYLRDVDARMGHTEIRSSQRARNLKILLDMLESSAIGMLPEIWYGGQSRGEKAGLDQDPDAIQPGIKIGQDDWREQ